MSGRIIGISGPTVSVALKGLKLHERVIVGDARLMGEVVRVEHDRAIVQLYENTRGIGVREPVEPTSAELTATLGPGLLGQMFDGLQRPLEAMRRQSGPFIVAGEFTTVEEKPRMKFSPLKSVGDAIRAGEAVGFVEEGAFRQDIFADAAGIVEEIAQGAVDSESAIAVLRGSRKVLLHHPWPVRAARPCRGKLFRFEPLVTGQRCIDFLFPLAKGGTAIFPGGFGTGKTILEQSIAKFANVDIVVYVGCGERGNEMAEMLDDFSAMKDRWTDRPLMSRTIVVVNTSNMPVAARESSIYTAVTMAEYYRDMGYHVLLLADSLSRWAEALREISSALEEMPGDEGYPTTLASRMAEFFARAGLVETLDGKTGSLTLMLSVSPPGGDFTEPVTQACMRTTGSFFMLDTALAHRRHFPAIDWFQSFSLYEEEVASHFDKEVAPDWSTLRRQTRAILQQEEKLREVAEIVGTESLQESDRLVMKVAEEIRTKFLAQNAYTDDAFSTPQQTHQKIKAILDAYAIEKEALDRGKK